MPKEMAKTWCFMVFHIANLMKSKSQVSINHHKPPCLLVKHG
jgi:hypothetical protein